MKAKAAALIPFVPSGPDFEKALAFFAEMGFETTWKNSDLAALRFGGASFLLQNYHLQAWAENQMVVLEVDDLDVYWAEIDALDLPAKYPGVRTKEPTDFPWGREVNIIDPAGVCWHIRKARYAMRPTLVPELICSDLDKSVAFYVGLLGFRVLYARPEDRFAYLDRDGAELMLEQPHRHDRLWPPAALEPPFGRGMNLQIGVEDVDALHAAVVRAGLAIFLRLEERWYRREDTEMGVRQFVVQDPDGYLIRLQQDLTTRPITAQ